jgi:phage gpG-like protein
MELTFIIEGEVQLNRRIKGISDSIKDWSNTFDKSGKYLKEFFSGEVFSSEGSVIGEPWPGGKYYHKLQRTGKMKGSFIYQSAKDYVLITNTAPYFKYHQSNLPRRKLPRRIMMKLDEMRKQKIVKLFHEAFINKANAPL